MSQGILKAHVTAAFGGFAFGAHHTYVTSDKGHSWGCMGNSSGGTELCSGSGNVAMALCMAGPQGHAGVFPYAVAGDVPPGGQ